MKGSATDEDGARRLRPATGLQLAQVQKRPRSKGGPPGLPFLPNENFPLGGLLVPHSKDLKAAMSAPSLDERPLPTTELHMLQLSWSGIFTARRRSRNSTEDPITPGATRRLQILGEQSAPLSDLSGNILTRIRMRPTPGWVGQSDPGR